MQQPKISVIVPIYNVEAYLAKCLDSLINQTLKEIEIICINDCSTDSSLSILKEYARRDSRIKCIDAEKNRGLGLTRNAGLEVALGDYISFVDSDDWLDLDCLQVCYDGLVTNDLDVIYFGTRYVTCDNKIGITYRTNIDTPIIIDNSSILDYYIDNLGKLLMMVAWNKIYKRTFLQSNQLCFFDIFYEDNDYSFRVHYYAKKYMLIPQVFYNYYQRPNSIVNTLTHKHAIDMVKFLVFIKDFLLAKNEWDNYSEFYFKKIVKNNLAAFSSRIININNDLEQKTSIKNTWLASLQEHNLINEVLPYLSIYELQQMLNVSSIVSKYEKLYYSEWASFGRLGKCAKILYLVKKIIKFLLSFIKIRI